MGVPKFYRWISEHYPLINQIISDTSILPEIDNFYLDMNGIIHACTHPNDNDMSKTLTMREMMLGIFRYIDRMVSEIVRPKRILFMAIDGVAPRAKLNQQRARRFRSAQDREDHMIKARQRGEVIDEDAVFDSNCITPGTEFMESVGRHLRWFIRKKIKEDPIWRNLRIIFSGHDVPGEGEHKIMEFIRQERSQPGYLPNQRHCMYGQDADLIMLGLASHEPHFTLLREVVNFNTKSNNSSRQAVIRQTKEVQFQLLHISVLREYIEVDLALGCAGSVDKERLIDDFILLTFLVGNDFLPHLPTLDIGEHAFDVIFGAYKELLNKNPGYIVKDGEIEDFERLETLFRMIGEQETRILQTRDDDVKHFNAKRSRRPQLFASAAMLSPEELEIEEERKQEEYENAIREALGKNAESIIAPESQDGPQLVKDYRGRYYYEKFKFILISSESNTELSKLMMHYLQGLMWCLAYYVKGCISWQWYFPYHYGPMLQDMVNLTQHLPQIRFEIGEPFKPFQQLLGCLPPLSRRLVPPSYQWLMTNPSSPVIHFYPTDFSVDQDGKKNPWEAVVLLPFIDEVLLMENEAKYCPKSTLTESEIRRNSFGSILIYTFDPNNLETYPSCNPAIQLPDINQCQSLLIEKSFSLHPSPPFQAKLIQGTVTNIAGFPSLGSLPVESVKIDQFKINVFGSESKYKSVLIELDSKFIDPSSFDLKALLGRSVYVNYPTFHEARVVAITTKQGEFRLMKTASLPKPSDDSKNKTKSIAEQIFEIASKGNTKSFNGTVIGRFNDTESICYISYDEEASRKWLSDTETEVKRYFKGRSIPGSAGLIVKNVSIRMRVVVLQGMKLDPVTGARKKVFGKTEADVPLPLAAWTPLCDDMRFQETDELPIEKFMPYNSEVIAVSGQYRGMKGKIVGPHGPDGNTNKSEKSKSKKLKAKRVVRVEFEVPPQESPFGYAIAMTITDRYYSSRDVCRQCDLNPQILGMIVGSIFAEPGRYDLGLNLKKSGQFQLFEYVRKVESENDMNINNVWTKSDSVQVVGTVDGNEEAEETHNPLERVTWEYSDRAIDLIKQYKSRFPQLFANLKKLENMKVYTIAQLLSLKANQSPEAAAEEVMTWMKEQPFYKLQRTPLTTACLSQAAMKAIEKAADIRTVQVKSKPPEKVVVENFPVDQVFRGDLLTSNDAPLSYNDDTPPRLGDRVVNLVPSQAPFGLRGTVIVVHKATHYVEVIFDEEFVGGKNLQGFCSQFRGRLCSWSSLLRVSTDQEWLSVSNRISKSQSSKNVSTNQPPAHRSQSASSVSIQQNVTIHSTQKQVEMKVEARATNISEAVNAGRRVTDLLKSKFQNGPSKVSTNEPSPLKENKSVEVIGKAPDRLGGFTISRMKPSDPIPKTAAISTDAVSNPAADAPIISHAPENLGGFRILRKATPSTDKAATQAAKDSITHAKIDEHSPKDKKSSTQPSPAKSDAITAEMSKLSIKSNGTGLQALSEAAGNIPLAAMQPEIPAALLPPPYFGYVPVDPQLMLAAPLHGQNTQIRPRSKSARHDPRPSNQQKGSENSKASPKKTPPAATSKRTNTKPDVPVVASKPQALIIPSKVILKRKPVVIVTPV